MVASWRARCEGLGVHTGKRWSATVFSVRCKICVEAIPVWLDVGGSTLSQLDGGIYGFLRSYPLC